MVKITCIEKGSPAYNSGVRKGDNLISVNGNIIEDAIDFNYYTAEEPLELVLDGKNGRYRITCESAGSNGIEVEELKIKHCGNNCIFCFINQNPEGMRKTIYIKDEDYRFSFLYGNYFTLTKITQKELDRIIKMKLSPLYVSVHAVNNEIRKKLLGIKKDDDLIVKIKYLTENGIELHTQIVLCPGINDGIILSETIETLGKFYPNVRSVAVVPVGLTMHREHLPHLEPVSKDLAAQTIKMISVFNKKFKRSSGTNFVFAADEFYIKAELEFPPEDYYEDYLQYEDGVGMVRNFIERFQDSACDIPEKVKTKTSVTIVTGELFYPVMNRYVIPAFKKVANLDIKLLKAGNSLFGSSVTVAGLLGGEDIIKAAGKAKKASDILMIPSTCLNYDGKFLDDLTMDDLALRTGFNVIQVENPVEIFDKI